MSFVILCFYACIFVHFYSIFTIQGIKQSYCNTTEQMDGYQENNNKNVRWVDRRQLVSDLARVQGWDRLVCIYDEESSLQLEWCSLMDNISVATYNVWLNHTDKNSTIASNNHTPGKSKKGSFTRINKRDVVHGDVNRILPNSVPPISIDTMLNMSKKSRDRVFIVQTSLCVAYKILHKAWDYGLRGPEIYWVVFQDDLNTTTPVEFKDVDGDTAFITSTISMQSISGANSSYDIMYDIYTYPEPETRRQTATWNTYTGLIPHKPILPIGFRGFNGKRLLCVTKHYPPFVIKNVTPNGTVIWSGICLDILHTLADVLNFTVEMTESKDNKFGIQEEDGQWNGNVGDVYRGEADLVAGGLTVTSLRESVIDFTYPYWEEPSAVLLKKSEENENSLYFLRPLHWQVWLGIFGVCWITSVVLWMTYKGPAVTSKMNSRLRSYINCLEFCFRAVLLSGPNFQPRIQSARIVVVFFLFFVIVMNATYVGNLVAFLTVNKTITKLHTLDDLVEQNEMTYGLQNGIIQMMLFQDAKQGVYKRIWDDISNFPDALVSSTQEGIQKTKGGGYAFIGEKTNLVAEVAAANNSCQFEFLHETFFKSSFAFGLPEGSPYVKYFSKVISAMVESGLTKRWEKIHWPRTDKCTQDITVVKPISLEYTRIVFFILISGISISCLTFFAELLVNICRSRVAKNSAKED